MSFDIERIRKSTREVARFLKKNPRRPSADAVHDFRTSIRKLETTFTTLDPKPRKTIKRLLRRLAKVRKHAGKTRDMDVLTADALTIKEEEEQDCTVQLIEYLGAERSKSARKLRVEVDASGPALRRGLKKAFKGVDKLLTKAEKNPSDTDATPVTMARALKLSSELNSTTRLDRRNLHAYRLKVKELRNVLQLSDHANEQEFVAKLGEVKDAIGEWHDWEQLIGIATPLLDHGASCKVMKHLSSTSKSKYEHAISLVNQLQSNYLRARTTRRVGRRSKKKTTLSADVLKATSSIAEPDGVLVSS